MFERLTRRHLDDAALAAVWTRAAASGQATSPAADEPHLTACVECRVRFDAFAAWMTDVTADARLEADAAFPPERLAAQQAAILRRLEAAERPARVIAFPKVPVGGGARTAPVRRWIAAAAAAGLLVGVGLGQLMDFKLIDLRQIDGQRTFSPARPTSPPRIEAVARPVTTISSNPNEEVLLMELEAAATPQYEALRAYDTLTPRAADYVKSPR
jgi:hypothetical protein